LNTSSLKIALVVKSLDPTKGGHEKYMNRMLRGLLDKGCRVWCFAENFGAASITDERLKKIRIHPLKLESSLRVLWFNFMAQRMVRRCGIDFDLVFTSGSVAFGDIYRAGGGVHETYIENCLGRFERLLPKHLTSVYLQRRLFKKNTPEILITNSEMVKNDIQRRYGVSERNLRVVRNGIDLERFNPTTAIEKRQSIRGEHGFVDDDFVCLFTAGGGKRKGLPELLNSFASIKDEKVKLLIVGRTDESNLKRTVDRYGLRRRVVYAGYQPDIEYYYGATECLVFPSKYDAAANVVCEALACGILVVTTATNGSSELIEGGKNGYVIDRAENYPEMIRCIEKLAESRNLPEMREAAIRTGQTYSMTRHLSGLEAVLSEYLRRQN
jgi:UDP-glucose:(heptosyl)LPS alpha-1,3-glucosyltransferase